MEGEEPKDFPLCDNSAFGCGRFGAGGDGVAGFCPNAGSWRRVFLFLHVKGFFPIFKVCT